MHEVYNAEQVQRTRKTHGGGGNKCNRYTGNFMEPVPFKTRKSTRYHLPHNYKCTLVMCMVC